MGFFRKQKKKSTEDIGGINFSRDRVLVRHWLEDNRFDITQEVNYGGNFGILRAEQGSNLRLQVSTFEKLTNGSKVYLAINIDASARTPTNFKLSHQGEVETPQEETQFSNDVISLDKIGVEHILLQSSEQIKDGFERIQPFLEYFTLSGKNISIELGIEYRTDLLVVTLTFLMSFISFLKNQFSDIFTYSGQEDYRCVNCEKVITLEGDKCPYCNHTAPRCVICYADPEPGDMLVQYVCCGAYAHQDHAANWKKLNDICPHCKSPNPRFKRVSTI